MSATPNIVKTIFDAVLSEMESTLGAGYVRMRRVFDPKENDTRTAKHSYSLKHGPSTQGAGVLGAYTMSQDLEMTLCRLSANRDADQVLQDDINEMHDKVDQIYRTFVNHKLGLGSVVLTVDALKISEPELLDNGAALLKAQFTVKYRQAIT